ncbi:helix-turn-helix domain-containing protein [Pedobacter paludis]|uniref:HTH araC/xylS-type domain-containing protein n=1 Tax=Pedobacter paludis TaxID=2203212 RepID=A0A317F701_9SPHI|nr:helix-turn-helix domain-containing protein [Pedobacter paludis]PWS33298.1 hypothetical protein DF947_01345 [Pedobacter paludis]
MKRLGEIKHAGETYIIYAAKADLSTEAYRSNPCLWRHFCQLVENHYLSTRRITFYANKLHLTISKLERLCKQQSGLSPSNFLLRRTLMEAEHLLQDTGMPLKEISYHLGFAQQSHFTQYFRHYKGISPGEFRKHMATVIHQDHHQ